MTEVFPPETTSTGLYPQHADFFTHLDSPSTPEEWAMRNAAESRIRAAMAAGSSYSNMCVGLFHSPGPKAVSFQLGWDRRSHFEEASQFTAQY